MPEPIFMKLGMHIMAPETISMAYLIPPISLCVYMCIPLSLLGNGSVETLPLQRIHTQRQQNRSTRRVLCGPCRIKESRRLVLSRPSRILLLFKKVEEPYQQQSQFITVFLQTHVLTSAGVSMFIVM
jgi:hypothetical protein